MPSIWKSSSVWKFCRSAGYRKVAGEYVIWATFRDAFRKYVADQGGNPAEWTKAKIQKALGVGCPIGRGPGSVTIVGNLSTEFSSPRRWVQDGDKVRLQKPPEQNNTPAAA